MDRTERVRIAALVAVGGAVGSFVRWLVGEALGGDPRLSTVVVNVVGCGLLAVVTAPPRSHRVAIALGGGFCGGLTTFSTFAVDLVDLVDDGRSGAAVGYLVASVALGLLAFAGVRRVVAVRSAVPT